jgi:tetratricopeptide (TPR) repeat protein
MRQNRFTESRRHFQKAVESDPQNYLAHYNYALMLQREQVDESQFVSHFADETVKSMREALGRARQLNPNFADTYKQLAFINLVLSEDLDEALDLIRRAIEIAPGREDFQYTLAQIQLRQKDYEAARLTARTLAAEGRNAEIRDRAKSLIEVIDKIEQQLARMKAESEERSNGSHSPPDAPQRPPLPGQRFKGDQVRGFLTRIDCTDTSITLTVRSGARIFKLHSPDRGKLIFVKYTPEIPNTVVCGAVNPASPVIVTYRASQQSRYDGEAIGVEFVKPDNL